MPNKVEKILAFATSFEKEAIDSLVAEAKKKEKKKLDPKAKVRNRGTVCVPAEQAKDKKDHFPINNEAQARNALARVNQFSKVPDWYSGSLQGLVSLVARKVKAKYPSIEVSKDAKKPGKKKASEYYDYWINKFAQEDPNTVVTFLKMNIIPSLQNMKSKLQKLEEGEAPGSGRKGTIDAAIMQLDNALGQASQAQREAMKDKTSNELNYYLSEIAKYWGYAQTYAKNETGVLDTQLQGYIDAAVQYAKGLGDGTQPAAQQQQQTPAAKPAPRPSIPYNKNVEIAQQQLANMGGYDLGTTGRYGNGVDGQMGRKTIEALKKYNPDLTPQQAIAELVQKYNAPPEPVKQEEDTEQPATKSNEPPKTWGV